MDGDPAWKKAGKLVVVKNTWLAKNLDHHHIIIDIRPVSRSGESHIKTAIALEANKIVEQGEAFVSKRTKTSERALRYLADKKAPIILYGEDSRGPAVMKAYQSLVNQWGYKNVTVLDRGFTEWTSKNLPVESGPAGIKIAYVKKLVKGAVSPVDFRRLQESGEAVVLDVRADQEAASGKIKNAVHIPGDMLEANLGKLSKSDKIIIHCKSGLRAEMAYNTLKNKGFADVSFLNSTIKILNSGKFQIGAEAMGDAGEEISPVITDEKPAHPSDQTRCALMIRAGREHFDRGRFKEAIDFFRKAIQADPYSARAWHYFETCFINAWAVELKNRPAPPPEATTSEFFKGDSTFRTPGGAPASSVSVNDEGC